MKARGVVYRVHDSLNTFLSVFLFTDFVAVSCESERLASKRTRKKKTVAELKDDESTLLKERRQLKRQLAALRLSLEKQRASNENLKRIKIGLQANESILEQYDDMATAGPIVSDKTVRSQPLKSDERYESNTSKYVLPDLNMALEEPDVVWGQLQHSFL
ncbi:Unknown protein [Striga hermonthica]|uniref:Uncharacterized protein n=1 Tax=Striga hermonthica TaxID=68872 RepID=A0A9N7N105_STRHE|nr:Unknown protein [Striga hermonthica]